MQNQNMRNQQMLKKLNNMDQIMNIGQRMNLKEFNLLNKIVKQLGKDI